jgi:hypothetical protein
MCNFLSFGYYGFNSITWISCIECNNESFSYSLYLQFGWQTCLFWMSSSSLMELLQFFFWFFWFWIQSNFGMVCTTMYICGWNTNVSLKFALKKQTKNHEKYIQFEYQTFWLKITNSVISMSSCCASSYFRLLMIEWTHLWWARLCNVRYITMMEKKILLANVLFWIDVETT